MHTYTTPGLYEVCLTVSNENASHTYCEWIEVIITSGHEPETGQLPVKVYPNPADEYVVIAPQQRLPQGASWRLCDALGRTLRRAPLPEGQPQLVLDLSGLAPGLYLCVIEAGGGCCGRGRW